jgi:hypothetical protein
MFPLLDSDPSLLCAFASLRDILRPLLIRVG